MFAIIISGLLAIIVFYFMRKNKSIEIKAPLVKGTDIGMYFMELHDRIKKQRDYESEFQETIVEFYYLLGCASQGRTDEIKEIYKDSKNENQDLYKLITSFKPQIDKMSKVSKRIADADIGYDMKDGESIGEYESRKLMKSKVFMEEFTFFKNLNLQHYFKK